MKIYTVLFFLLLLFPTNSIYAQEFTIEDVSSHNTPSDCYMIFENSVYDITNYLDDHDRYLEIDEWCGKDMTEDFKTKAGEDRDHKASSYALLENYKIGEVTSLTETLEDGEEYSEDELYSVEISGDEIKLLSIKEVAELWGIDAEDLLDEIINEYDLTGEYTTDSVLDSIREEYKFSPAQIKDIAESIKQGNIENTSEVNTHNNPYNFNIILITSLIVYWGWYYLTKRKLKAKILELNVFNAFWNTVLVLSLIPAVGFGIFMVIRYSFPSLYDIDFDFLYWHVEGSLIMGLTAIFHLLTRIRMYLSQLRFSLKKNS